MDAAVSLRAFRLGVTAATGCVAAFLLARLHAWPPHEDEVLALFVGGKPVGEMLDVVLGERGGAPLHFLLVHLAALASPTLTAVRMISVVFAVASIPATAALLARLSDRRTALIGTAIVAASWVTLFHGIYGRMYSLFLFTAVLSFLALLRALERRRALDWSLWALALLAVIATHQYGVFIVVVQAAFAGWHWLRERWSPVVPVVALAAVIGIAYPIWRSHLVLASRFDVGVGQGSTQLGGPWPVLEYLRTAFGDFAVGWTAAFVVICALAALGLAGLWRSARRSAVLVLLALLVPVLALVLVRVGGAASTPESRHLVFFLPFFALLVATGLGLLLDRAGRHSAILGAAAVGALVALQIGWGYARTPTLYAGEPPKRAEAREAAAAWLAATSRPSDILFGYDPLYLGARERGAALGDVIVPRADAKLALSTLLEADKPLGRGVWVLDASDGSRITNNDSDRLSIDNVSPGPGFETRAFGPFLVVRTVAPTLSPAEFLRDTVRVQVLGANELDVPSSPTNYYTARAALRSLETGA